MNVQALGHVVLKVRNLQRSEDFFSGVLGMPIVSRISDPAMTFFALETSGNPHDFALMEVGFDALSPGDDTTGLAHVAFKIGGSAEELDLARRLFDATGTQVLYEAQRGTSRSVHVLDPDRNEIELYVDVSDVASLKVLRSEVATTLPEPPHPA
jgi:catechol 2,3-dioxygenase